MRLTGWHIDAFGTFRDVGLRGLPPGLVVVHGPNAAGKSTLLAFIQRTLFGYPHRNRQDVNHYEPADGDTRRGGRLFVEPDGDEPTLAGGETIVERHDGTGLRVVHPGAATDGEATLAELTGGCDDQLFNAVFAFDLDDLRSIASLTDDAVRDRLFSAGVRGAGRSARTVHDRLDAEARQLWTPRSRTATIDRLQARLREVEEQLEDARRLAAGYPERLAAENASAQEVARVDDELAAAEARERYAESLLGAWPVWRRREEAAAELAAADTAPRVAVGALERHERLRAGLDDLSERLEELDRERRRLAAPRDSVVGGDGLPGVADGIGAEPPSRDDLERDRRRLTELRSALSEAEAAASALQAVTRLEEHRAAGPPTWLAPMLGGLAALLAVAGVLATVADATAVMVVLLMAATGLVGTAAVLRRSRDQGGADPAVAAQQRVQAASARLAELARELGLSPTPTVAEIDRLAGSLERADRLHAEVGRVRGRHQRLSTEHAALLAAAGVADEEQLREAARRERAHAEVRERLRRADDDLVERLGTGAEAERRTAELARGDREAWTRSREQARRRRRELVVERDTALEALVEARRAREQVESSERVIELDHQRQVLLARRDEHVHDWRVASLGRRLVAHTLEGYERARQPGVLRRAGQHLAEVTAGAHPAVVQHADELLVLDDRQRSWRVGALSRGTAEQLYLCLRLALAEDLASRQRRLPLVMDDVLVNFDPERAREVSRLLVDVATGGQLLYFTCHPHTVGLLREAGAAAVYDLPRGGLAPARRAS